MNNNENERTPEDQEGIIDTLIDGSSEALSGVPAPIKKNFFKAVSQLCTAIVDVPVSYLEGKAAENRAETEARVTIIKTNAKQIAQQMNVDPAYAQIAVEKYSQKILREQINLDSIVQIASEELTSIEHQEDQPVSEEETISDDWLNAFEKEAGQKSSEEMKLLFGKILAGEISKPSTFSIRTLRLLSQLDNAAASLFQKLCSLAISIRIGHSINDARVISFSGSAAKNSLQEYGLHFPALNILEEYGLVIPDYNSYVHYDNSIAQSGKVHLPITYLNKEYGLVWTGESQMPNNQQLQIDGVALSKAGKELLSIVDVIPNEKYTKELVDFFKKKNFQLVEITQ